MIALRLLFTTVYIEYLALSKKELIAAKTTLNNMFKKLTVDGCIAKGELCPFADKCNQSSLCDHDKAKNKEFNCAIARIFDKELDTQSPFKETLKNL